MRIDEMAMLIIVAAVFGGSSIVMAGGAALCRWSPRIKRELIGDIQAR